NPFNAATALNYQLTASGRVQLALYALTGQKIRTLVDEERPAGRYTVLWDGRDDDGNAAASGTYFCRLRVEREGRRFSDSRRLTLVR
ncbi:MAG TPA: FlgD immunoglobulin-like domain containing protein, partial [bacterium]|nr:FlgD immunoglobulin-like domain containing protein [bacterium]